MLQIDGTLIVAAISFLAFMLIMHWIFYQPVQKIREERQKYIEDHLKKAEENLQQTKELYNKKEEQLKTTRVQAHQNVLEITEKSKAEKAELLKQTKEKAQNEILKTKEELGEAKNSLKNSLKNDVIGLAQSISAKILGENIPITGVNAEMLDTLIKQ